MIFWCLFKKSEVSLTCSENHRLMNFDKWIYPCNSHPYWDTKHFHSFSSFPCATSQFPPSALRAITLWIFITLGSLCLHGKFTKMKQYITCPFGLTSFVQRNVFAVHVASCFQTLFLFFIFLSFQDTFDKDRHKESGTRDIQQLDADLSATRNQLNQVQDE